MGDISQVRDDTMQVMRIDDPIFLGRQANAMVREMVRAEWLPGPDDKIEAVAWRMRTKYGVEPSVTKQCWNRPPREMKVSRWMNVLQGYARWQRVRARNAERQATKAYEEKRGEVVDQVHPALLRLADFVAGRVADEQGPQ